MSNHLHSSHNPLVSGHGHFEPRKQTTLAQYSSFLIIIAAFLLFAVILGLVYLPNRGPKVGEDIIIQREQKLADLRAKEKKEYGHYAWVDQAKGVVQIPVPLAMEITVRELSAAQASKTNP